jgi:membrane protease YdiL (CAAX protease family)
MGDPPAALPPTPPIVSQPAAGAIAEAEVAGEPILDEGLQAAPEVRKRYRSLELFAMFAVAPSLLANWMRPGLVFPAIWTLGAICLVALLFDRTFERRRLWNFAGVGSGLRPMLLRFCVLAPALALAIALLEPARFLQLPRQRPALWAAIMVGYPVFSVYAQEVAFRAFFFHRYAALFRSQWAFLGASALAFGYAHVILHNWIAVAFSAAGGLLFGLTYRRTRSLAAVCLEHALYGCFLFTIGWGQYLYGGAMVATQ